MRALGALFLGIVFLSSLYFVSARFVSGVSVEPQVLASSTELTQSQRLFLDKINSIRKEAGASELNYSNEIEGLTDFRVLDMSNREYYSHKTPDGVTYANYLREYNIATDFSCENLQLQIGPDINEAINAWVNSTPHYNCLIDNRLNNLAFSYEPYMLQENEAEQDTTFVFAMIASN